MNRIVVGAPGLGDVLDKLGIEIDADADEGGVDMVFGVILKHIEQAALTGLSGVGHGVGEEDDAVLVIIGVVVAVVIDKVGAQLHAGGKIGIAVGSYI